MISSIVGIALDCPDANELAAFYEQLLGWPRELSGAEYAALRTPHGLLLVFQTVANYAAPVWPWQSGLQQQMAHMDFLVDDLPRAEQHALACGARRADTQYYETATVLLDPAGHPFCLTTVQQ